MKITTHSLRFLNFYGSLFVVAAKNTWLHRSKNLIVAGLLALGTFLIVVGYSILKNVEDSMQDSIISSVAAHLQIYSKDSTDKLALFGGSFMGREDIAPISDYQVVKDILVKNPEVREVVPMGFDMSILSRGNELDDTFTELRSALKKGSAKDLEEMLTRAKDQILLLRKDLQYAQRIANPKEKIEINSHIQWVDDLDKNSFWEKVRSGDEMALMHLEAKIAPLSGEKSPIYLRYLGTSPTLFTQSFTKFKIVEGSTIPHHERGMLLSQRVREEYLKNMVGRLFDRIQRKCIIHKIDITKDAECKRLTQDLSRQHMEILIYLSRDEIDQIKPGLEKLLQQSASIEDLVKGFLQVTPDNFAERRQYFYDAIADKIKLYEISPGETINLRTYTKSGYVKTLPLKIWGIFAFEGIEDSDLAGSFNIVDLISFRELYGQMTEASKKELESLKKETNIKTLSKDQVENELFGASAEIATTPPTKSTEGGAASKSLDQLNKVKSEPIQIERTISSTYDDQEMQHGLALNLAVFLKDKVKIAKTIKSLNKSFEQAGFSVQAVDWREASGFVGQFVEVVRYVLSFSIAIILFVALIIINNTLVVSVFSRVREIGTLRAIGMQKVNVAFLFLIESAMVAFLGTLPGACLGALVIQLLHRVGIPAVHDVVVFLFSGPVLRPTLNYHALIYGPLIITIISVISSLWVARRAAAVSPALAMQEKE